MAGELLNNQIPGAEKGRETVEVRSEKTESDRALEAASRVAEVWEKNPENDELSRREAQALSNFGGVMKDANNAAELLKQNGLQGCMLQVPGTQLDGASVNQRVAEVAGKLAVGMQEKKYTPTDAQVTLEFAAMEDRNTRANVEAASATGVAAASLKRDIAPEGKKQKA